MDEQLNWQENPEHVPLTLEEELKEVKKNLKPIDEKDENIHYKDVKEKEDRAKIFITGLQEEFNSFVKIDDLLNNVENNLLEINEETYNDLKEQI